MCQNFSQLFPNLLTTVRTIYELSVSSVSKMFVAKLAGKIINIVFGLNLSFYKRYVDDIVIVWHGENNDLFKFLYFVNPKPPLDFW